MGQSYKDRNKNETGRHDVKVASFALMG